MNIIFEHPWWTLIFILVVGDLAAEFARAIRGKK